VTALSSRRGDRARSLAWLGQITARFGQDNVRIQPGDGDWTGYLMVYIRASLTMPWRFSGNAYRAGDGDDT